MTASIQLRHGARCRTTSTIHLNREYTMTYTTVLRAAMTLVCATSLAACNRLQRSAEAAVRDGLKDPESARFGEFYYNEKTKRACLTVNAKNSMGGYTGDKEVHLQQGDNGWNWIGEEEETKETCRETFADKS